MGKQEDVLLSSLSNTFSECAGWCKRRTELGKGKGDIDFLAYNRNSPNEVLLIEAKAFLEVNDIGEVYTATEEMIRAQGQLSRYMKTLREMPQQQRESLFNFVDWSSNPIFFPMVVTPDTEATGIYDHRTIPASSLEAMKLHLSTDDWLCPSAIWNAVLAKRWLLKSNRGRDSFMEVELAGIKCRLPFFETRYQP